MRRADNGRGLTTNRLQIKDGNRNCPFIEAAADSLATEGGADRVFFVSSFRRHVPRFDACALYFSKGSRGRFGTIEALRVGEEGLRKGEKRRYRRKRRQELARTERIAVFADRELREDTLDTLFGGRTYRLTRRGLEQPRASPSEIFVYRSQ